MHSRSQSGRQITLWQKKQRTESQQIWSFSSSALFLLWAGCFTLCGKVPHRMQRQILHQPHLSANHWRLKILQEKAFNPAPGATGSVDRAALLSLLMLC